MTDTPIPPIPERVAALTAPTERPEPSSFNALIWWLWPLMAWLFPVLLFVLVFSSDAGGWEMLFLLMFSPVILPVYALLNLIPRRIIRKGEDLPHGSTGLTTLLILHWWGLATFAVFFQGIGDSGGLPSLIGDLLRWLPDGSGGAICLLGGTLSVLAWIGLLMYPTKPVRQKPLKTPWLWPLLAFAVPPLTITLALTLVYANGLDSEPDAGGTSESQALALSVEETQEVQNSRWNALQAELVPLRTSIAADGWIAVAERYPRDGIVNESGLTNAYDLRSYRSSAPSYTIGTIWQTQLPESFSEARARVGELAAQQSWEALRVDVESLAGDDGQDLVVAEELFFAGDSETRFQVNIEFPRNNEGKFVDEGISIVTIQARSAEFWKEGGFAYERENAVTPAELDEFAGVTFASNEWPELRYFQAPRH